MQTNARRTLDKLRSNVKYLMHLFLNNLVQNVCN